MSFDWFWLKIRSKHETGGDFRAQVAANHTGIRRLTALIERLGLETITDYTEELIEYTERRTRAEVAKLPQGEFSAEGVVDSDGFTDRPVRLAARIRFEGARGVQFDMTGSDPQRRAPVNSTYAQTYSACAYVLKSLIDPDLPVNDGFYRLMRIVAPAGSVVHCRPPAPVVGGWKVQTRLADVMFKALAPALPDTMPAGTKAMQCHAGFGAIHPASGEYYCFLETLGGGYGARAAKDGPDAVQTHGQNTENAPIEETESNYPVRILRYELVNDSEGAGTCRGGLGLRRDYLFTDHEVSFTILADRERWGPHGLFGGLPGRRAGYLLNSGDREVEVGSKQTLQLKPGQIISYRTCGGGGYGPPHRRSPRAGAAGRSGRQGQRREGPERLRGRGRHRRLDGGRSRDPPVARQGRSGSFGVSFTVRIIGGFSWATRTSSPNDLNPSRESTGPACSRQWMRKAWRPWLPHLPRTSSTCPTAFFSLNRSFRVASV